METKERILSIAYKLFINNGYHSTSMQQLVNATELSKGAFYHYFKNKKSLYEQVIYYYFSSYYRAVDWNYFIEMNLSSMQVEQEIHKFYLNFVPQILASTEKGMSAYYIMYFEAYNTLPFFKGEVHSFYSNLKNLLQQAIDNDKSHKNATSIIAKYEGILFLLAIQPEQDIETLLMEVFS